MRQFDPLKHLRQFVKLEYMAPLKLTPSMEDYLEAILLLENKNRVARVNEIASLLDVQMPSVTVALKTLRSNGLINHEKNSYINLTESGMEIAKRVEEKHHHLAEFLEGVLMIPPDRAQREACDVEHVVSSDTILRLKALTSFIRESVMGTPRRNEWLDILEGLSLD